MKRVDIPIYVTRKNANGMIGSWTIDGHTALFLICVVLLNFTLWGAVGIWAALRILLGWA